MMAGTPAEGAVPGVGPAKLDYHSNSEQKELCCKTDETLTRLSFCFLKCAGCSQTGHDNSLNSKTAVRKNS